MPMAMENLAIIQHWDFFDMLLYMEVVIDFRFIGLS